MKLFIKQKHYYAPKMSRTGPGHSAKSRPFARMNEFCPQSLKCEAVLQNKASVSLVNMYESSGNVTNYYKDYW